MGPMERGPVISKRADRIKPEDTATGAQDRTILLGGGCLQKKKKAPADIVHPIPKERHSMHPDRFEYQEAERVKDPNGPYSAERAVLGQWWGDGHSLPI